MCKFVLFYCSIGASFSIESVHNSMQKEQQQISDKELVQAILNGDTERYAEVVERYQQLVANLCYKLGGDNIDVQEATQAVFVELYFSLPRFKFESKLSTYIYRITLNVVFKTLKKNKRYIILNSDVEENYSTSSLDEDLINAEKVKELHSAINKLKYEQKVALTLHCFEDMSYKEVAEVMDVSLSKVETLIFRAKKSLKKILIEK